VSEPPGRRFKRATFGRIAAKSQHVLDSGARQIVKELPELGAAGADAGHVRNNRETDLLLNLFSKRDGA
jgi:hypothetical protein